jgi:hypothetical protein
MADANVRLVGQSTHSMAVMAQALEHRETVLADAIEALVESRHAQVDTEAQALLEAVNGAINRDDADDADTVKAQALERGLALLEQLAAAKFSPPGAALDLSAMSEDQIVEIIAAHPDLLQTILTSPKIAAIAQAQLKPPEPPDPLPTKPARRARREDGPDVA